MTALALAGALGCVPRVHVEWSTEPDLPIQEPLRFAVVDEAGQPKVHASLTETVARAGRLAPSCDAGAEAVVRLTDVVAEERIDTATTEEGRVQYVVPTPDGPSRIAEPVTVLPSADVTWHGRVHLSWIVEKCDAERIEAVDAATVAGSRTVSAPTAEEARRGLPDGLLDELVRSSGHALGRRLVPTSGAVSRRWFRTGDPRLRLAGVAVREGHWEAAVAKWSAIVDDPAASDRARARAWHDLAVHHEAKGQYPRAYQAIESASRASASPAILRYRQALERTWTEVRSLRDYHYPLEGKEAAAP